MPMQTLETEEDHLSWKDLRFFKEGRHLLVLKKLQNQVYVPEEKNIFRALVLCPRRKTRVVILGQDPYPGYDPELQIPYACGLAFSVDRRIKMLPGSLRNIIQELETDMFLPWPKHGDLSSWAPQGVLLLNTCLTTQPGKILSHAHIGWSELTTEIVQSLEDCVWMLWGSHAQRYESLIRKPKLIIKSSHPSGRSAHLGFLGSKPFSTANAVLDNPIDWELK